MRDFVVDADDVVDADGVRDDEKSKGGLRTGDLLLILRAAAGEETVGGNAARRG